MNLWDEILARIETKVNRHSFYTWFRPTMFMSEDRVSVTVQVPNAHFKEWLTKHYSGVIAEAATEVRRPNIVIHFVADMQADPAAAIPLSPEEAAALENGPPPVAQPSPSFQATSLGWLSSSNRVVPPQPIMYGLDAG